MSAKFTQCGTCYFNNHAPEICEGCVNASEYVSADDPDPTDEGDDIDFGNEFTAEEF